MLTIDRIAKLDSILGSIITALYRAMEHIVDKHETLIVNAAYKVVEAKAGAIGKAAAKISDLEDAKAEATASYIEAKAKLRADFQRLVESLDKAQANVEADMHDKIANAALALVAANKAYDQTLDAAYDKLSLGIAA